MSKLLELTMNTKVSGSVGSSTYTVVNKDGSEVSIDKEYNFPIVIDTNKYGSIDLNSFHDTNRAFTLEFTLSDQNLTTDKPYNYVTIGKKTYSQAKDAITIGVSSEGKVVIGAVSHDSTIKFKPLVDVEPPFVDQRFQFNYDPNQSLTKRATLYVNDKLICKLDTEIGTELFNEPLNILDFIIYFGTSGTVNEVGYENKMDLATNITFTDKITLYSGTTMDKLTTYFQHVGFSNAANHLTDICNNKSTEIIHTTFRTNNDIIQPEDIRVSLSNVHSGASNVGESVPSADPLVFEFKFSNLDRMINTNNFIDYDIEYLGKQFNIVPTTNRMYVDSFVPSLAYGITDVGNNSIEFELTSITDGDYAIHTRKTNFDNYNVILSASNVDGIISSNVYNPTLSRYTLSGLDDGVYYDVSASISDTVLNTSNDILPNGVNGALVRKHYTNATIRTTDITAPSNMTMSKKTPNGLYHGFTLGNILDNAVVDESNVLTVYHLLTSNYIADENELKATIITEGASNIFTSPIQTLDVPFNGSSHVPTNTLTNGDEIEAEKYYYFYSMLKDADNNSNLGKKLTENNIKFFVNNEITFDSMVSDNSTNTRIAKDTDNVIIEFDSKYKADINDINMTINGDVMNVPDNDVSITVANDSNFTIKYHLESNAGNHNSNDFVNATVNLESVLEDPDKTASGTFNVNDQVLLRGRNVENITSATTLTSSFTATNTNQLTTTDYLTNMSILGKDKIIQFTSNVDMVLKLYDSNDTLIPGATKRFVGSNYTDIVSSHSTLTFEDEHIDEGYTYTVKAELKNDLDQTHIAVLHSNITTLNIDPIIATPLATSDTTHDYKPSIRIDGLVVNDLNSTYDVYLAALHSNVFPMTSNNIKTFFDNVENTKRLSNVAQGVSSDVALLKSTINNDDEMFETSDGNFKVIKSYYGSSPYTCESIPIDTSNITLIGMVQDNSFGSNYITFHKKHEYTYAIENDISVINNKNTSSEFVKHPDELNISWKTNYQTSSVRLSLKLYDSNVVFTPDVNKINWNTTNTIIPSDADDATFIRSNLTLELDGEQKSITESLNANLQIDKTAPLWEFVRDDITKNDSNITMKIEMQTPLDTSRKEPMLFMFEASNDGSNATTDDIGKTFITSNIILDFSTATTDQASRQKSVTLSGLSPGLDYFIKGQLYDVNSNALDPKTYIKSGIVPSVIYTTDSVLPQILNTPDALPSLESVRVQNLQVGDSNSIYSYRVGISSSQTVTYALLGSGSVIDGQAFASNDIPRGAISTLTNFEFTNDIDGTALTSGTSYYAHAIVKDDGNNEKAVSVPFTTDFITSTSEVVDTSGAGGVLTHYFNYDLESLTNSLGSPHGLINGLGAATYVDGFVGSNAIFLNANATDNHSIKVSTVSMSNHEEMSFATWLKSYNHPDPNYKKVLYYDDDHFLHIKDNFIEVQWGSNNPISQPMEYSSNDWNHLSMTVNTTDSEMNVYWNASNVFNTSVNIAHPTVHPSQFYIGGDSIGNSNFKGILEDTRIYNSIITEEDVGLLYSKGGNVLEITFDETGELLFTNDAGTMTSAQIAAIIDTTDTATGDASITFDGDTTLELSNQQIAEMETTTDGLLTESTVSFWIKPTSDTFADSNVIMEYFADIGYTVTVNPNGTLQFDVVDNTLPTDSQQTITITSGAALGASWRFDSDASETTATNYFYYLHGSTGNKNTDKQHAIQYNTDTQKWSSSSKASGYPLTFETSANPQTVTTNRDYDVYAVFTNPYYVAP